MFCSECGNTIKEGSGFCTNCGMKIMPEVAETPSVEAEAVSQELNEPSEIEVDNGQVEDVSFSSEAFEVPVIPDLPEMPEVAKLDLEASADVEPVEAPEEVITGVYTAASTERPITPDPPKVTAEPARQKAPQAAPPVRQDPIDQPMTLWAWIGTFLLMLIPVAQLILPFVWAFSSSTNKSKKTFFQAYLIVSVVMIVLGIVFASALALFFTSVSEEIFY